LTFSDNGSKLRRIAGFAKLFRPERALTASDKFTFDASYLKKI